MNIEIAKRHAIDCSKVLSEELSKTKIIGCPYEKIGNLAAILSYTVIILGKITDKLKDENNE